MTDGPYFLLGNLTQAQTHVRIRMKVTVRMKMRTIVKRKRRMRMKMMKTTHLLPVGRERWLIVSFMLESLVAETE